jgi:hypothetical protein
MGVSARKIKLTACLCAWALSGLSAAGLCAAATPRKIQVLAGSGTLSEKQLQALCQAAQTSDEYLVSEDGVPLCLQKNTNRPETASPANHVSGKVAPTLNSILLSSEFSWVKDDRNYNGGMENNPVFETDLSLHFQNRVDASRLKSVDLHFDRISLLPHSVHIDPAGAGPFDIHRHRVLGTTTLPPVIGYIQANGILHTGVKYNVPMVVKAGIIPIGGIKPLPGQSLQYATQPIYQILTDRYDTGIKASLSWIQARSDAPIARLAVGLVRGDVNPLLGKNDGLRSNSYPGYVAEGMVHLLPLSGRIGERVGRLMLEGGLVAADAGSNPGEKTFNDSAVAAVHFQSPQQAVQFRAGGFGVRSGKTWVSDGAGPQREAPIVSGGSFLEASVAHKFKNFKTVAYAAWNRFAQKGDNNRLDGLYWTSPESTQESETIVGVKLQDFGNVPGLGINVTGVRRNIPNPHVYNIPEDKTGSLSIGFQYQISPNFSK